MLFISVNWMTKNLVKKSPAEKDQRLHFACNFFSAHFKHKKVGATKKVIINSIMQRVVVVSFFAAIARLK